MVGRLVSTLGQFDVDINSLSLFAVIQGVAVIEECEMPALSYRAAQDWPCLIAVAHFDVQGISSPAAQKSRSCDIVAVDIIENHSTP